MILHAGPLPSTSLALLVLLTLAVSIFIAAAIISDFQREEGSPSAKRGVSRSNRRAPDS